MNGSPVPPNSDKAVTFGEAYRACVEENEEKAKADRFFGKVRRHHINENLVQKAVKEAAMRAGISKRVSCHTLRHSFLIHSCPGYVLMIRNSRRDTNCQ